MPFFTNKTGNRNGPAFWSHYKSLNTGKIRPSTLLNNIEFTIIDTETTGLDPRKDRIISFASIRISDMKIIVKNSLDLIIQNQTNILDVSRHIHEITDADKSYGINEENAVEKILDFIGNSIITGIHIVFDLKLLNRMLRRCTGGRILNRTLDIGKLARRLENPPYRWHSVERYDLKNLSERYQIPLEGHHTAPGDTYTMALLFLKLISKLDKRGITTWKDLNKR